MPYAVRDPGANVPELHDTLLEVRSGKMRRMRGLQIETAIDKTVLDGPVYVSKAGIVDDEHDYTFHGGSDKAIHGYCRLHYAEWQNEYPTAAPLFKPGAFGENFVLTNFNERNVCIGDIMSVGSREHGIKLQVSLSRTPCFKLNHRFSLRDFAPVTSRTSRTGWYYRVLEEGYVCAGDEVRLLERPHPSWTIERIQEYLHRNPNDMAMNKELAAIPEFGAEGHNAFQGRVIRHNLQLKAAQVKNKRGESSQWREFVVTKKYQQTPRIVSLKVKAVQPLPDLGELSEGAHAKMRLGNGLVRAYSIVSGDMNELEFGIGMEDKSKGASVYIHHDLQVGDKVQIGRITEGIEPASAYSNHIFVAGGIGITAFLPLIEAMRSINYNTEIHYAVRSEADIPYRDRLLAFGDDITIYDKAQGQRLSIPNIIRHRSWNSKLYFCGPASMMDEALLETKLAGVWAEDIHMEAFSADTSGPPFEALVARSTQPNRSGVAAEVSDHVEAKTLLKVGENETLLQAIRAAFGESVIDSSCEVGNCGTCQVKVRSGQINHRGTALSGEEKDKRMLSCISRGVGQITVEI